MRVDKSRTKRRERLEKCVVRGPKQNFRGGSYKYRALFADTPQGKVGRCHYPRHRNPQFLSESNPGDMACIVYLSPFLGVRKLLCHGERCILIHGNTLIPARFRQASDIVLLTSL